MQICNKIALMVVGLSLTACANLTSISRNTPLSSGNVIDGESIDGKVIHLDAQQRAIIQMGTSYCAEGSPDAIQSIAASQSLGVALTGQGSGSGSNSLASAVASIGLRTQSIQLMRDLSIPEQKGASCRWNIGPLFGIKIASGRACSPHS